MMVRVLPLT